MTGYNRGSEGCLCVPGAGPDTNPTPNAPSKVCNGFTACIGKNGLIAGIPQRDGYCQCFNDFYGARYEKGSTTPLQKPGSCQSDCRNDICSNHGRCIGIESNYNNACQCDSGWTTSARLRSDNTGKEFERKRFCNIPIDNRTGKICGYWADESAIPDNNYCQISQFAIDAGLKPFLTVDSNVNMFVQSCPVGASYPMNQFKCSGTLFGTCVPDGRYGEYW